MDILVKGKIIQTFGAKMLVQSENLAEKVNFIFDSAPEGGYDLTWSLMWMDESDNGGTVLLDKILDGGKLVLVWNPTGTQTQSDGRLTIQLKGVEETEEGIRRWLSIASYLTLPKAMEPGEAVPVEPELYDLYLARFEALYQKTIEDAKESIDSEAAAKLEEISAAMDDAIRTVEEKGEELSSDIIALAEEKSTEIDSLTEARKQEIRTTEEV